MGVMVMVMVVVVGLVAAGVSDAVAVSDDVIRGGCGGGTVLVIVMTMKSVRTMYTGREYIRNPILLLLVFDLPVRPMEFLDDVDINSSADGTGDGVAVVVV
jgi:hypothetical protein